jgi:hypothetical protein
MSDVELKAILELAKEQVPFGIYAVRKADYVELLNEKHKTITQLKKSIRAYKSHGFKVYFNKE